MILELILFLQCLFIYGLIGTCIIIALLWLLCTEEGRLMLFLVLVVCVIGIGFNALLYSLSDGAIVCCGWLA